MAKKEKVEKIENVDIRRGVPSLKISCKDCVFLKSSGAYKDDKGNLRPCSYFGVIGQAEPCRSFVPDPRLMKVLIGPALQILGQLPNPDVVFGSIFSIKKLKQVGMKLGQRIYFHVLGGDYIGNYASGYIIGMVQGTLVVEGSEGHVSHIQPESAMDEDIWNEKLASLLKANKVNDPNGGLRKIFDDKGFHLEKYLPPLLRKKKKKVVNYKKTEKIKKSKTPDVIVLR